MTEYAEYISRGDRWDLIAFYAYGDATKFNLIIRANTSVPITVIVPAGIRLLIPILPPTSNAIPTAQLPPWKV